MSLTTENIILQENCYLPIKVFVDIISLLARANCWHGIVASILCIIMKVMTTQKIAAHPYQIETYKGKSF